MIIDIEFRHFKRQKVRSRLLLWQSEIITKPPNGEQLSLHTTPHAELAHKAAELDSGFALQVTGA